MKRKILLLPLLAVILTMAGCMKTNDSLNVPEPTPGLKSAALQGAYNMVPNEMLIKFSPGTSEAQRNAVLDKISGKVQEKILTKAMEHAGDKEGVSLVSLPGAALEAIARVKELPGVEYAEPNYIYTHCAVSNDTYFINGSLWGMYGSVTSPKNDFGSQAAVAWAAGNTGSSTVYIGIIDEGYMYSHADLAANAGVNPGEIAGNGRDDDSNGLVDDVYGWDFDGNNNTVFDGTNDDHGTHVAGTIGAAGGNGAGVAGVCWNVKLLSAKFLGNRGGTTANAIKAVDYFTVLKNKGLNIVATNNSWGGGGFSQALQDAIERANAANILFIAAAGNDGLNTETSGSYPSGYPNANIIAVASITSTGGLSSFSNYAATRVDLGAPGSGIYSTVPKLSKGVVVPGYASYSGTSMATPHVTGACALYAATHPGATATQIKNAILSTATPTFALAGKCGTGGRLNVSNF